jgi:hypothetical protein
VPALASPRALPLFCPLPPLPVLGPPRRTHLHPMPSLPPPPVFPPPSLCPGPSPTLPSACGRSRTMDRPYDTAWKRAHHGQRGQGPWPQLQAQANGMHEARCRGEVLHHGVPCDVVGSRCMPRSVERRCQHSFSCRPSPSPPPPLPPSPSAPPVPPAPWPSRGMKQAGRTRTRAGRQCAGSCKHLQHIQPRCPLLSQSWACEHRGNQLQYHTRRLEAAQRSHQHICPRVPPRLGRLGLAPILQWPLALHVGFELECHLHVKVWAGCERGLFE